MAEQNNQPGAKPVPPAAPAPKETKPTLIVNRTDVAVRIASAILTRQAQRNPISLAREAVEYTDALLAALDQ